jgi:competence ComEA-like helix-hairpin-helix protein
MLHFLREHFGFSRTELNGFLILIPLMAVALIAPAVYRRWVTRSQYDNPVVVQRLDSLVAVFKDSAKAETPMDVRLFEFDPNTAKADELKQLGFPEFLAGRIINYRSKGGQFRKETDLLKIYGMDTATFQRVQPYIRIAEKAGPATAAPVASAAVPQEAPFDLNLADTTQLKEVFGIGSKLAFRIVRYRESLGGFIRMNQLSEVFGLDAVVIEELKRRSFVDPAFVPRTLNINKATAGELDKHPYINAQTARAIAAYRLQHGAYAIVDDLKKVELVTDSLLQKLRPYVALNAP